MLDFYPSLTEEQIEGKISSLSPNQTKVFLRTIIETDNRRDALFIASSYPIELEDFLDGR